MDRTLCAGAALFALTASIVFSAFSAEAQPPGRLPRIGWLVYGSPPSASASTGETAALQGLRELGWVEGKNVAFEFRYAEGRAERLPGLARELVGLKVDLIIVLGGDVAKIAKGAAGSIPLVMGTSSDPVRDGLVASLARPGGNATGVTFLSDELAGKRLELLAETMPGISRVAVIWDPAHKDSELKEIQAAAPGMGVKVQSLEVRRPGELEGALQAAKAGRAQALVVASGRLTTFLQRQIAAFAAESRLPVVSAWGTFADAGALLSYGPNPIQSFRRTAVYVDKILKGAKPADLPVERPTKFDLVINLRTAKALGITIPPEVLLRADRVIR